MDPYQDRSYSEQQDTADVQNTIRPHPMEVEIITPQEMWVEEIMVECAEETQDYNQSGIQQSDSRHKNGPCGSADGR